MKFNFFLEFVTNSEFQFELFKTIFKTPEVIRDMDLKLPYDILRPKILYINMSQFPLRNRTIGPVYDYEVIRGVPDVVLPLQMAMEVEDEFWEEMLAMELNKSTDADGERPTVCFDT